MMKALTYLAAITLTITFLGGCNKSSSDAKDKTYPVQGKVVAVDLDNKKITLDHEDIPGVMRAMKKMPFDVDSPKLLEGIKPGDMVQGKVKVNSGDFTIVELTKR